MISPLADDKSPSLPEEGLWPSHTTAVQQGPHRNQARPRHPRSWVSDSGVPWPGTTPSHVTASREPGRPAQWRGCLLRGQRLCSGGLFPGRDTERGLFPWRTGTQPALSVRRCRVPGAEAADTMPVT